MALESLDNVKNQRGHGLRMGRTFVAPLDGLSHVSGDRSQPLMHKTIPAMLAETVAANGPRDAAVFVEQGRRFTWNEFAEAVDALAAGLLKLGLSKGDRIGIWSPNRWEWLVTQFATARIGLILVNINPAYRLSELEYALNKVGCVALVTAVRFKTSDYLGMIATLAPELEHSAPGRLEAARLPHLKTVIRMGAETSPGMFNFEDVMAMGGPAERERLDLITASLEPGDAVNIQFTSGTTGAPKGATLTHVNILNNASFVTGTIRLTRPTGSASRCRSTTASAWSWARSAASPRVRRWSSPARASMPARPCAPSRPSAARASTACRPCSSPSSTIPISLPSTSVRCAPASWPARPARSR